MDDTALHPPLQQHHHPLAAPSPYQAGLMSRLRPPHGCLSRGITRVLISHPHVSSEGCLARLTPSTIGSREDRAAHILSSGAAAISIYTQDYSYRKISFPERENRIVAMLLIEHLHKENKACEELSGMWIMRPTLEK
ncbi:hypothetical protein BC938DRAFT_478117 [Jimgerdemannia flammicorona]|uniref:Uncharacterized protein n=1 Tax=Jimgerdemannia flammicorona TaxID=994334 RepID=A0A433QYL3_9FUNG|nr:hypothetical protein BC938DRAFT_478117 [Jimgerdemannia flammicorona]